MKELTTTERRELQSIRNDIYLLSQELVASHSVLSRLFAAAKVIERICKDHGGKTVDDPICVHHGTVEEYPESNEERWEAVK